MLPCTTRRWLIAHRASGLNGEKYHAWGWTALLAEGNWMVKYYRSGGS